jgi:hypothetical protein
VNQRCVAKDFDEAERGPQPPKRRVLVGIDRHRRLPRRRIVQSDSEVQVDPAPLPLDLVDLALAVLLAAWFEGEQFRLPRKLLEFGQHLSDGHLLIVVIQALLVTPGLRRWCSNVELRLGYCMRLYMARSDARRRAEFCFLHPRHASLEVIDHEQAHQGRHPRT